MRGSANKEYLILMCLSFFTLIIVFLSDFFKVLIGLPYVLFVPGYLMTTVFFPKSDNIEGFARLTLSVGLSIIIVPLIGLINNYLPWGITLLPMMISLTVFNIIFIVLGWLIRKKLPAKQRFSIQSILKQEFKKNRIMNSLMLFVCFTILITLICIIFAPNKSDCFTQFYITGQDGTASGYPKILTTGKAEFVKLNVENNENKKTDYKIVIKIDGSITQTKNISLNHLEKWDDVISIISNTPKDAVKVDFVLYKDNEFKTPYRQLYFWIKVGD